MVDTSDGTWLDRLSRGTRPVGSVQRPML
jgi:hypothetical protein